MAKRSSTKSDLFQILIFTFLLCALFFGAWGGYSKYSHGKLLDIRQKEKKNVERMQADLKNEENRQARINYQRQQDLLADTAGEGITAVVQNTINRLPPSNRLKIESSDTDPKEDKNIIEYTTEIEFADTRLENVVKFAAELERERPDIRITRLNVVRKLPRGKETAAELPDEWSAKTVRFSTYVNKDAKPPPPAEAPAAPEPAEPAESAATPPEPAGDTAPSSEPAGE